MKILMISMVVSFLSIPLLAQSDSIVISKSFGGYKFEQNGQVLNGKALLATMETDQEAYALMKKSKSNSGVATVMAGTGGFLIGWTLGTMVGGGEPNWILAGVGAGCLAVGIPLSISATNKAREAVDLYNSHLAGSAFRRNLELRFGVTDHGVGLALNF